LITAGTMAELPGSANPPGGSELPTMWTSMAGAICLDLEGHGFASDAYNELSKIAAVGHSNEGFGRLLQGVDTVFPVARCGPPPDAPWLRPLPPATSYCFRPLLETQLRSPDPPESKLELMPVAPSKRPVPISSMLAMLLCQWGPINENNPFRRYSPSGQNLTDRTHGTRVSATQTGGCPVAVRLFFSS
jgi:hypothetical protein